MEKININITGSEKIWFTSDQHFGHSNIIKFCNRPFSDIKEMESALIENWNNVVGKDDIVFTLGDFCWNNNPGNIAKLLSQLNGKDIYVILGNHDKIEAFQHVKIPRVHLLSDVVHLYIRLKDVKIPIECILSHYPLMTWSGRNRKSFNLHGHVHSRPHEDSGFDANLPYWKGYQKDVGVDAHNYSPVDLQTILYQLENEKAKEDLVSDGYINGLTKIDSMGDDRSLSIVFSTFVEELNKTVKSEYDFELKELYNFQESLPYPAHPIIEILRDHKNHIIEEGGPWIENIINSEQFDDLIVLLKKYKKEP